MSWFWLLAATEAVGGSPAEAVAPLGTENVAAVASLAFTFNVESGGKSHARSWTWSPATGAVTKVADGETVAFTFGKPEGAAQKKADAQFVNDSFWLLPQLHLRWAGPDLTVTEGGTVPQPIGGAPAHLVVMQYAADGGGYTPGDAYDLYLDPAGRILSWSYWEGGKKPDAEASLSTTFEAFQTVGPLTIATEHRSADGAFRLFFTDLAVTDPTSP